ncbi:3-deoxy-D-manno-octulosonic acid kinase [Vibrio sp. SM6]|uniref:3-deoxy-D-manno-octulosonic acid kinase n=1 Tax=Vibrio agarilyticus TaxID=2726741 RepID=A0A7X8YHP3_9VIBR|nr:3-deoxy-D-manno-octulosonic acid kinase [Vibrio agarilyticus]NLS13567.1 3-deoxy-D-manno-octulosonic acid kinase [Vibrio agarilyticus]
MIRSLQCNRTMIWYNEQYLTQETVNTLGEQLFSSDYWQSQDKIVGSASGRGTTWFIQLPQIQAALRHYRRGGLFGKLVADSYWFQSWQQTRGVQELMLLEHLRTFGVNVPRPVAARAIRCGVTYRADLMSERIPNAQDLVARLVNAPLSAADYHAIGAQIGQMHRANVDHTDLNIHNILLDTNNTVWIIDFDKCSQREGQHWQPRNLERLKRSFIKEQKRCNIHWHESEFKALLEGYRNALTNSSD